MKYIQPEPKKKHCYKISTSVVIDTTITDFSFCRWNYKTHAHATF